MSKESKPFLQVIQSFSPDASLTSTDALNHKSNTERTSLTGKPKTQQQSKMQCYLSLKREYSMAEYLFTVSDKKLRSTLTRLQTQRTQADDRDGQTQTNMAAPGAEIVFTLWPESDGNRTALPNRVLQIHRYTNSVLRQNTADPSHIYNSSRPGETSVYCSENTRPAVCLPAQYVSLCHHRREDTHLCVCEWVSEWVSEWVRVRVRERETFQHLFNYNSLTQGTYIFIKYIHFRIETRFFYNNISQPPFSFGLH